ncbi:MAG: glycosyltransferase family 2 protein [Candidatus Aminicenantes bacterium]|nr:glycosyltransferase family 2 protein [Candidatus Aminicenantes bacterium]
MKTLSVVIPVFNEEKAIADTLSFFSDFLNEHPEAEVIFVDDGSRDGTGQILADRLDPRMRLISHPKNRGYGAALKSGIKAASSDVVAMTDADGSYPNEKISAFFLLLLKEKADMVVGARQGKIAKLGFFRRCAKRVLRRLAEYLSESQIPDLNSGLRLVRKDVLLRSLRFLPEGFSFTTTLTLFLLANDCRILYSPIDYFKRTGKSKIRPFRDTMNFLQLIVRTVMFFKPLKVFLPLSLFFIFLSVAVLVLSTMLGRVMDITTILLFVTGLQILALGLLADLIDKRMNR